MSQSTKKKIYLILTIVGIILLTISIALLIIGILKYINLQIEYTQNYNIWREKFLNREASISDAPSTPSPPAIMIIGIFMIFINTFIIILASFLLYGLRKFSSIQDQVEDYKDKYTSNTITEKTCPYCNTTIDSNTTRCPSCHANLSSHK